MLMKKSTSHSGFGSAFGTTSMGERGQVVIPKEARDKLKLRDGDKFLVVEHFGKIVLVPEKMMRGMIEHITRQLNKK